MGAHLITVGRGSVKMWQNFLFAIPPIERVQNFAIPLYTRDVKMCDLPPFPSHGSFRKTLPQNSLLKHIFIDLAIVGSVYNEFFPRNMKSSAKYHSEILSSKQHSRVFFPTCVTNCQLQHHDQNCRSMFVSCPPIHTSDARFRAHLSYFLYLTTLQPFERQAVSVCWEPFITTLDDVNSYVHY